MRPSMLQASPEWHYRTSQDLSHVIARRFNHQPCPLFPQMEAHAADPCYHPAELAERRVRLAVGLKRYFHGKRVEGLLSASVRLLCGLCAAGFAWCRQLSGVMWLLMMRSYLLLILWWTVRGFGMSCAQDWWSCRLPW